MDDKEIKVPTASEVRQAAIRLLARRDHSRHELQQKLQQRGYPKELITQQLERLIEQGLLSEARFVESYIRARSHKGYGPLRIINELQQRGISAELIENNIDQGEEWWTHLAQQVRQKRFGNKSPKDFAERSKQIRFLQYRGFAGYQIKAIYNEEE